jgi:hypothetical protein
MAPLYEFEDEQGNYVERFFGMEDAPRIGDVVTDPENLVSTIRRLPSNCTRSTVADYYHVAHSVPRVHDPKKVAALREREAAAVLRASKAVAETDPVKHGELLQKREELLKSADDWRRSKPIWNHTTPEGKPVFTSKAQVEEFRARTGRRLGWNED